MYKKIIVAMDFSETADRAALAGVTLAKGLAGNVVLVHVMAPGSEKQTGGESDLSMRGAIEARLKELSSSLSAAHGITVDWGVVDGDAADELSAFASRWKGDMLIVGSTGKSGVRRMIIGSVTDKLVRIAQVPVLVVGPVADADGRQ